MTLKVVSESRIKKAIFLELIFDQNSTTEVTLQLKNTYLCLKYLSFLGLAFPVFADKDTKEGILKERYKGRTDKYLSLLKKESMKKEKDAAVRACLEKVYHDIGAEFKRRDIFDYWIKPKSSENMGPRYADSKGLLQCGIIHKDGALNQKQKCKQKTEEENKVPHEFNPCRTYLERALLELFELDHE